MDIIVCVKRVPETAEADVVIDEGERQIKTDRLTFDINEADNYALEEAILLKEKLGGSVSLVTMGPPEADDTLRVGLAKGATDATRLSDERFQGSDAYVTAKILCQVIQNVKFDLILTGCMASDDGYTQVGATVAEILGIPHATMVVKTVVMDGGIRVHRELEGGVMEVVELDLPALLTIQTGINEPRYASFRGIREAAKKDISVYGLEDIALSIDEVGSAGSRTRVERLFLPPVGEGAEILEGAPDEAAGKLAEILKEKGMIQ